MEVDLELTIIRLYLFQAEAMDIIIPGDLDEWNGTVLISKETGGIDYIISELEGLLSSRGGDFSISQEDVDVWGTSYVPVILYRKNDFWFTVCRLQINHPGAHFLVFAPRETF